MSYQDIWLNGKLIKQGTRECADRYAIIRQFCAEMFGEHKFSVCDVGAASCYFGLRLREDFPNCSVVAFEPREYEENCARLKRAKAGGVVLFGRKLTIAELPRWADFSSFDLVLALSVLHHVERNHFDGWIAGLRGFSRYLIAELSVDDSRSSGAECYAPDGASVLGYGKSHIKSTAKRPIVIMEGFKHAIACL